MLESVQNAKPRGSAQGRGGGQPRRRRTRWLTSRLFAVAMLVLAVRYPLSGCVESRVFYWPSRAEFVTPPEYEDITIDGPDGRTLHGWFIRSRDAEPGEVRPAVLHVHGNAGSVDAHRDFCDWLADRGFHVMLFDYRGFGRSDRGRPHRHGLREDTLAAWDVLTSRADVDPKRCAIFGFSMGGVVGLAGAAETPEVRTVVVAAPFADWPGVAHDHLPVIGPLLIRRGMDAEDSAAALGNRPLLIVHGDADRVVNVRHASKIADRARQAGVAVETMIVPGAGHEDLLITYPEVRDRIEAFLHSGVARRDDRANPGDVPAP